MDMLIISGREVSEHQPPYVIAEISANHNGSLERAKLSIEMAAKSGANAVKIQTYNADTMTIDCDKDDFIVKGGLWNGYKLYDLYHEAYTPYEWHQELFRFARKIGITLFSTPFDETAVDLLESLNTPAYKIASFELTDLPLIRYVAKKKKPMLMSTGMASEGEITEALECARSHGCDSILLFHCISSYPAPVEQANIRSITQLKKTFGVTVGLSDHTIGNIAATASVALGASAIEKHFTISRADKGPDSAFSIEPGELEKLVKDVNETWSALGKDELIRPKAETNSRVFRRSLYFVNDIKAGTPITPGDVRRIRPGYGLPPKHYDDIIGKTTSRDVERGQPVAWDDIQKD
ncbi:pseudaminic acid synthase [Haematospirillum jordaniae]|uniref:Pseudaminic acid synthase n=2 Tax=Haematospirillum jordaniae TaxID=1549855 RepID=A0A143DG28_9PROT|nr:pseudaminic acid synthase [Haematospirillum jordaniae]NKD45386.1 pseudaminic acid synthase [Haematospirillum jordaniae]NKD56770.1 pseudaminic acid synthase [Haematospirillum jordaniae]NKD59074.1 pseudaminic acid synthase [Haematospirillum jordaniae]NKD66694.1 pseudaminic acid synthase [Haematospirillum jordaniae]